MGESEEQLDVQRNLVPTSDAVQWQRCTGYPTNTACTGATADIKVAVKPYVNGKFLFVGLSKFHVKGVTYGTFEANTDGFQFPPEEVVRNDFSQIQKCGFNAVRVYTVPPRWLLDAAWELGIFVMVGIPWAQHITFLDEKSSVETIKEAIRIAARHCSGHPAVLCYSLGNEIPVSIVRWYGRSRIEHFLKSLYRIAKEEDPDTLVTYVNYPTTEYLRLDFLDFISFNVYLEAEDELNAYVARLQIVANDKPLMMAEIGLDSRSASEQLQGEVLQWQIQSLFAGGCVGTFIFAWTDEWHTGGHDIENWDFGLTTRNRVSKPALGVVSEAFQNSPFPSKTITPGFSVVVCTYNGATTIRHTLEAIVNLNYPDYEVIVVDDGSVDNTAEIVSEYDVALIRTENRGLSNARNTGYRNGTKELIAFIDDDAYPDEDWLQYLAICYRNQDFAGVGGPNLAPLNSTLVADCVANSPGGPIQVLLSDSVAEHIPGCNMSFRRNALDAVNGFDSRFRAAGDDVDICWRIQDQVGPIGFSAAAMNWHFRRDSIVTYWRQQLGYGKAEALLEAKWPEKYNQAGHISWKGQLYGNGLTVDLGKIRQRIYQGVWGQAPFQRVYENRDFTLLSIPLMPEWYLLIIILSLLSVFGLGWSPLLSALPLLIIAVVLTIAQALVSAVNAPFVTRPLTRPIHVQLIFITTLLHLIQPMARLWGRIKHGLTPWRKKGMNHWCIPTWKQLAFWCDEPIEISKRLDNVCRQLARCGRPAIVGGEFDSWDMHVKGGLFGGARLLTAVEDHGSGNELVRYRLSPNISVSAMVSIIILGTIFVASSLSGSLIVSLIFSILFVGSFALILMDCGHAMCSIERVLHQDSAKYLVGRPIMN